MLVETTTFGVRQSVWTRRILERDLVSVETEYGRVRVKIGRLGKNVVQASPECEEVARLAREKGVPFLDVYRAAASENKKTRLYDESR